MQSEGHFIVGIVRGHDKEPHQRSGESQSWDTAKSGAMVLLFGVKVPPPPAQRVDI